MVMETCCALTPFAVIVIVGAARAREPVDAEITVAFSSRESCCRRRTKRGRQLPVPP